MYEQDIKDILKNGGVGIIATDTLFGLVGSAWNPQAVERIYKLKGREEHKPLIILIKSIEDLARFDVGVDESLRLALSTYWPGPVSIVLGSPGEHLSYLHRGSRTLAFRIPDSDSVRTLLTSTGPLVAPSANPQAQPPAVTLEEARIYFGDRVDFYIDGVITVIPSRVIRFTNDGEEVIRG